MLSVIIITKNEEANLRRCLNSLTWVDEIIIVDSGSTDATTDIAREFTEHVYQSEDWRGYGIQKQRALELATKEWVLNLDADEVVNDELKEALQEAMDSDEADAYKIPISMVFYNQIMNYSGSPSRHVRLFKRQGAQYSDDIVHEKILLPKKTRIAQLSESIMHYCYQDISHALAKMNRYSSSSARMRLRNHNPPSLAWVILGALWMFFRTYFLQRGFLDGQRGFVLAVLQTQGSFYRGVKQIFKDKSFRRKKGV